MAFNEANPEHQKALKGLKYILETYTQDELSSLHVMVNDDHFVETVMSLETKPTTIAKTKAALNVLKEHGFF